MASPTMNIKESVKGLLGEKAFAYIARARRLKEQGKDVISFGVGQPDVPTFDHIVNAGIKALEERFTAYTPAEGIAELREAVAEYLNTRYGSDVEPDEVLITVGTKGAAFLALSSYLKPGDEVIVPEPTYPVYSEASRFLGAKPRYVPLKWLGEDKGFRLDLEAIKSSISPRTKAITIINPHNPTGAVFSAQESEEIMNIARQNNLVVVVDEIYDNFIYDNTPFKSFISFPDWRDYVVYSGGFSKTFSMTGWRVGYLVVRKEVARNLIKLAVNIWSCPPSFSQKAAITALRGDWRPVREMVEMFRRRRGTMVRELRKIPGFKVWKGRGAFYLFPNVKEVLEETGLTVEQFADKILTEKYVVVLPGTAFPDKAGSRYLRFTYAIDEERIREGAERILELVSDLLRK